MELAPGQETVLHFNLDFRHRTGPQRFVCYLDEEGGAEWTYAIETTLYEKAKFSEGGMAYFGMVDPNAREVRKAQFMLYAKEEAALPEGVRFRSDSDVVAVEPGSSTTEQLPDGVVVKTIPLTLRLRAPSTPGPGHASIHAELDQHGEPRQIPMGVGWTVRTFYQIAPPQVFFGGVDRSGTPLEQKVELRRADNGPFAVRKVQVPHPALSHRVAQSKDQLSASIFLTLDPTRLAGTLAGLTHPLYIR